MHKCWKLKKTGRLEMVFGKSYFLIFSMLLCSSIHLCAQSISFTGTAIPSSVSLSEQFHLTYTLTTDGSGFKPPPINDFYVLQGPSQSTSMQFINGNMSQSISYSYVLQPKAVGTYKIQPATIEAQGKVIKSNVVTITVNKSAAAGSEQADLQKQIGENIYIQVTADKRKVVKGEGIKVTYKLFSKLDIVNFNLTKMPILNGFWTQEGSAAKKVELKQEIIDGVQYITCELKKAILFPQRDGELVLDPLQAEATVRIRTRKKSRRYDPFEDFFNDPFFGGGFQEMNYLVKSAPIKINVTPLPPNAPPSFTGAVGDFTMESYIDNPETKANEPVSLHVKITGNGNLKLIEPVKLVLPPDIETYDPKIDNGVQGAQATSTGQRKFEYLLIPRHSGKFVIKPLEFSYFSPAKNKFITLSSPEFDLMVLKGTESAGGQNNASGESIKNLASDIRYIKTSLGAVQPASGFLFGSRTFYSLLAVPVVFVGMFLFYFRRQAENGKNSVLIKSRKADKIAKKRLKDAKRYLDSQEHDKVYAEILRALYGYMVDKYHLRGSEISRSQMEQAMLKDHKNPEYIRQFNEIIDQCEFARYAPSQAVAPTQLYNKSIEVITSLETQRNAPAHV